MNLLPHFFSQLIRLISLFLLGLCLWGGSAHTLEFCDIADLRDDYDLLTARDTRVGPPDLFEARICTAWLWWKAHGPNTAVQAPDAEFLAMVLESSREFKNVVTSRMKTLWEKGKKGKKKKVVINISEAVPRAKQTGRSLHAATLKAMQEGADLIVRPFLMNATRFVHPDFLIKVQARAPPGTLQPWFPVATDFAFLENVFGQGAKFEGDPAARDYFYIPVIIKSGAPDVTNYAFDVDDLKTTPDFRLTVSSDYAVQMLHTLAVLQEAQYGVKAPETKRPNDPEAKFETADQRVFQAQGIFVLRNRGQLKADAEDYMQFAFFSRDTTGGDEQRLNRAFDPGHRAHMASFFNAQTAKNAEKVAPHRSSQCKGCPLKGTHIPEMEEGKDVSLLYLADRATVAHFQRTTASHGQLNTWEQIAKLNPKEAIDLFPTLDGVGEGRVIPELYRFIRQARALQDNAAIDNSPIMPGIDVPEALVETLKAVGIWSFRQLLDLEASKQWDEVVALVSQDRVTPERYREVKKGMGGRKGSISKNVKEATGNPFGSIWEYTRLKDEVSNFAPATQKGILGDMVAVARFELGYDVETPQAQRHLQDLLTWAHALENYRYFDVLTITPTDPKKYSGRYAIYFDIEGDPEFRAPDAPWMKTEYAWGLRVVDLQTGKSVYERVLGLEDFNLPGMKKVWEQWIEVVRRYPDAHVYYFSEYEPEVVKRFLRVFGPEIPKRQDIFNEEGVAYFDGLKDYRDFEKDWGMGMKDPAAFDKQRVIAEFILRTTPDLPDELEQHVVSKARKFYAGLHAYVVEAQDIQTRMVDFRREIMANFTLPVYAYDLKTLAKHYGFKWRDAESNALQSIVWFRQYVALKATDPARASAFLERIILYNTDDVRATEALHLMLKVRWAPDYLAKIDNPRKGFLEEAIRDAIKAYNRLLAK